METQKERLKESVKRVKEKKKIQERSKKRYQSNLDKFLTLITLNNVYSLIYTTI
jgi:hypothetical protein